MSPLIRVREIANADPPSANSRIFRELLDALEHGDPICLSKLYDDLDYGEFDLALGALKDWRLHRFDFASADSI